MKKIASIIMSTICASMLFISISETAAAGSLLPHSAISATEISASNINEQDAARLTALQSLSLIGQYNGLKTLIDELIDERTPDGTGDLTQNRTNALCKMMLILERMKQQGSVVGKTKRLECEKYLKTCLQNRYINPAVELFDNFIKLLSAKNKEERDEIENHAIKTALALKELVYQGLKFGYGHELIFDAIVLIDAEQITPDSKLSRTATIFIKNGIMQFLYRSNVEISQETRLELDAIGTDIVLFDRICTLDYQTRNEFTSMKNKPMEVLNMPHILEELKRKLTPYLTEGNLLCTEGTKKYAREIFVERLIDGVKLYGLGLLTENNFAVMKDIVAGGLFKLPTASPEMKKILQLIKKLIVTRPTIVAA